MYAGHRQTERKTLKIVLPLMERCGRGELILEQCLRATSSRSLQGEGDVHRRAERFSPRGSQSHAEENTSLSENS